ncbi:hypothetical protein SCH4B_1074 [Ruegeria sp. TrichCH4B]|nr:hypothetical protein SCH4B_1074 [Ruegeria sp. TrichCH4B]
MIQVLLAKPEGLRRGYLRLEELGRQAVTRTHVPMPAA